MHERIAVAFARRREQERRAFRLREAKRVVRAERIDLQRRDREIEVIDRARRRGEVEEVIELLLGRKM
jgi:hypothetical protein